jgi:ABC-2 type transport system ATP-binding protein
MIGVALQSTSLQDKITPREALRLFGSFYRERVPPGELLERFALTEKADARFETLSGGQRQRLAIALAFVNRPKLVLLDEPTTGLDPQSRRELHAAIAQMKHDGYTVLFTTHYLDEAEHLCDRVAIIDRGRIVGEGAPRDLIAQSKGRQSVTLLTSRAVELAQLSALPGAVEVVATDASSAAFQFQTVDANASVAALMRLLNETRVELVDLQVRKASLEDVFLRLTSRTEEVAA